MYPLRFLSPFLLFLSLCVFYETSMRLCMLDLYLRSWGHTLPRNKTCNVIIQQGNAEVKMPGHSGWLWCHYSLMAHYLNTFAQVAIGVNSWNHLRPCAASPWFFCSLRNNMFFSRTESLKSCYEVLWSSTYILVIVSHVQTLTGKMLSSNGRVNFIPKGVFSKIPMPLAKHLVLC